MRSSSQVVSLRVRSLKVIISSRQAHPPEIAPIFDLHAAAGEKIQQGGYGFAFGLSAGGNDCHKISQVGFASIDFIVWVFHSAEVFSTDSSAATPADVDGGVAQGDPFESDNLP